MTDKEAYREILAVREMYTTKTTPKQWRNMVIGLGHIIVTEKLSEHARVMLEATLLETSWRAALVHLGEISHVNKKLPLHC